MTTSYTEDFSAGAARPRSTSDKAGVTSITVLRVAADGLGNVYISGRTLGSLGGPNAGGNDAFVSKYDAAGNFQWTHQLGTSGHDFSYGVTADGLGNVYISGDTFGSLGVPSEGGNDAFVAKIADPAVPEPNTLLLLCFGSLAALWR